MFICRENERCRTAILPHLDPFPVCACCFCCPPGPSRPDQESIHNKWNNWVECCCAELEWRRRRRAAPRSQVTILNLLQSLHFLWSHSLIHSCSCFCWERIDECCAPNARRAASLLLLLRQHESLTFCWRSRKPRNACLSFHPQNQQKIFQQLEEKDAAFLRRESTKLFVGMVIFLLFLTRPRVNILCIFNAIDSWAWKIRAVQKRCSDKL